MNKKNKNRIKFGHCKRCGRFISARSGKYRKRQGAKYPVWDYCSRYCYLEAKKAKKYEEA
jgi:hypothetical protein